jgi:nitroimidazol reductase NimA-like FMN-containing flavoprotein (pyridoxamine 5'-phosphate oxidase superfamily)
VRRLPEKQVTERASLNAILDAARVAHVGVTDADGQTYVLPVAFARDGDELLVHGSTGSRLFRVLAAGACTCVTVTLLDGMVLARSAFESSMHYRSAMMFGTCEVVPADDVERCLEVLTGHLMPGRWAELRAPTAKELAATTLLRMPLTEWSVKVSNGWPDDPAEDLREPVWAGVLPIESAFGAPVPTPDLQEPYEPPAYLAHWTP